MIQMADPVHQNHDGMLVTDNDRHQHNIQPLNGVIPATNQTPLVSPSSTLTQSESDTNILDPRRYIKANHLRKLMEGDSSILDQYEAIRLVSDEADHRNSILHIAVTAHQHNDSNLIHDIISQEQALLLSTNSRDDLPIHVATRVGQHISVTKLIDEAETVVGRCNEMLKKGNQNMSTPLHIALENQLEDLAKVLFTKCRPTFYLLDGQGVSPLYLAIKAGFWDLVKDMLQPHDSIDPGLVLTNLSTGKSIIHAVIMAKDKDVLSIMLDNYPELMNNTFDEGGRTPLSYAAYIGFLDGVVYLLDHNYYQNEAYKQNKDGSLPIHNACSGGNTEVVEKLLSHCPHTTWRCNRKGQNILHVAAASGAVDVLHILRRRDINQFINIKDEDGNTPLHLATMGKHPKVVYALTWDSRVKLRVQNKLGLTALDLAEDISGIPSFNQRLTWLALRYVGVPRTPQQVQINIQNIDLEMGYNPDGLVQRTHYYVQGEATYGYNRNLGRKCRSRGRNGYKDRFNPLLMVSILVATVTFAAGFTVPGGYNNNDPNQGNPPSYNNNVPNQDMHGRLLDPEGMATLAHHWAFKVFVINDIIAFSASVLASVALIWAHLDDLGLSLFALELAMPFLGVSLAATSLALWTGFLVVLPSWSWLRILVLVIGWVFFSCLLVFYIPLYSPTAPLKYKFLRYIFDIPFRLMLLAGDKGKCQHIY